ncbi:MAG TPA: hypothetical protein VGK73_18530 [Polyangiaceae bacterium]
MNPLRLGLVLVPFFVFTACGGQSLSDSGDDDDAGTGGTDAGRGGSGRGGGSGSTGKGATGGTGQAGDGAGGTGRAGTGAGGTGRAGTGAGGTAQAGTGQGGDGCCLAFPVCPDGERQVGSVDECTPGASCHEVTVCCSTIVCTGEIAQCDAYPVCDAGDTQVSGACPAGGSCYTRSLCGTTITCLDSACDPATEYNREYLFEPEACLLADYVCTTPNTKPFMNDCGCGCEQDSTCPAHLGCYYLEGATDAPPPNERAAPATGGTGSGVVAVCNPEDVARCPYSEHY